MYGSQPAPYPPPPGHRRAGPSPVLVVLVTLAVVAVLAIVGWIVYEGTRPEPVTVSGSVTISSNINGGKTCEGTNGYNDIRGGASVVIHDSAGRVIATGQLDDGVGSDFATSEIALTCRFAFRVPDVPRQKFYGVEVSHRGTVQFSAAKVADGAVGLSLGDS